MREPTQCRMIFDLAAFVCLRAFFNNRILCRANSIGAGFIGAFVLLWFGFALHFANREPSFVLERFIQTCSGLGIAKAC